MRHATRLGSNTLRSLRKGGVVTGVLRPLRFRGQSTLEYILVLAAILVAVIVAANGVIRPAIVSDAKDAQTGTGLTEKATGAMRRAAGQMSEKLGLP